MMHTRFFFVLHVDSIQKVQPDASRDGEFCGGSLGYLETGQNGAASLETQFQFLDELFNNYLGKMLGSPRMVSYLGHVLADPHIYKERIPDIQDNIKQLVCGSIQD